MVVPDPAGYHRAPFLDHSTTMLRILLLLTTLLAATLAGCTSPGTLNAMTTERGYAVTANVPYDRANGLALDIYMPNQIRNAPVVVFFYGGRWQKGDKSEYKFLGQALASRGFVVVVPNVRLYPKARFPDFVKDGANAVKWARDNAAQFGGSGEKLFVMGHSSGAHIAAMLALNETYLKGVGGSRSWLKGMIGLAGPYDFLPITAPDLFDIFGPPDRFQQSQPAFFVDGQNPPLLLMHGEKDEIIPVDNTRKLAAAVKRADGTIETVYYPGMSHQMIISSFASALRGRADTLDQVESFVKRRANQTNVRASSITAAPLVVEDQPPPAQPLEIDEGIGVPQPITEDTAPPVLSDPGAPIQ